MSRTVVVVCLYRFSTQGTTYFHSIAKEVVVVCAFQPRYNAKKMSQCVGLAPVNNTICSFWEK